MGLKTWIHREHDNSGQHTRTILDMVATMAYGDYHSVTTKPLNLFSYHLVPRSLI